MPCMYFGFEKKTICSIDNNDFLKNEEKILGWKKLFVQKHFFKDQTKEFLEKTTFLDFSVMQKEINFLRIIVWIQKKNSHIYATTGF